MVKTDPPNVFWIVTVCVALGVLINCGAKVSEAGRTVTVGCAPLGSFA